MCLAAGEARRNVNHHTAVISADCFLGLSAHPEMVIENTLVLCRIASLVRVCRDSRRSICFENPELMRCHQSDAVQKNGLLLDEVHFQMLRDTSISAQHQPYNMLNLVLCGY